MKILKGVLVLVLVGLASASLAGLCSFLFGAAGVWLWVGMMVLFVHVALSEWDK